jgi:PAS domain S-box-containing protein
VAREALIALAIGGVLLFVFLALIGALLRMDLLKRHEAEEQLRLSEAEMRTTLRSIGDGVIATDTSGRIVLMNAVAENLTGWPEAEAIGRAVSEVFQVASETTGQPVENPITRVLAEGRAAGLANHTVLIQRTGERIPIADSGAPIQNDSGEIKGAVLVFRDIAEKRSAERDLQRLAAIVSSSEDAIVGETLDGQITDWNAAAERLFGYSSADVMGKHIGLLEPPEFEESTGIRLGRIRRGERVQVFDTTRVTKDGDRVPVSVSVSPIRDFAGAVIGASKVVRDITDRKNAEIALRASEERFRVLSDAVAALVWASDERGRLTYVNRPWRDFTGHEEGGTPDSWTSIVHPDDLPAALAKWQVCVVNGEPFVGDVRLRRKDGAYRWFAARTSLIPSRSGPIWVGTAADVDDLKTAASELRKAKEAAEDAAHAKDRFLAVLSHELRTPLTPALVASQTLERRRDLPEDARQSASLIRRNVELEALLVDDLLDLTKIARGMVEIRRQSVDVHELVRQVADICRSDLHGRRQMLSVELAAAIHHTEGDPARLQQVFWNLLKNAIKFTPVGGSISLRSENPQTERIRLSVKDTGIGIPAGILPRIFDPFERGSQDAQPPAFGARPRPLDLENSDRAPRGDDPRRERRRGERRDVLGRARRVRREGDHPGRSPSRPAARPEARDPSRRGSHRHRGSPWPISFSRKGTPSRSPIRRKPLWRRSAPTPTTCSSPTSGCPTATGTSCSDSCAGSGRSRGSCSPDTGWTRMSPRAAPPASRTT